MQPRLAQKATESDDAPVTEQEFQNLMSDLVVGDQKALAVAVSGGPDSMALAYCLKIWTDRAATRHELRALIVDHRLRPQSAEEAEATKKRLSHLGIAAEILTWDHEPIFSRLHQAARNARYRLLGEACGRLGASTLFLAHHADDQAETIVMRLAKGSGLDGLAGMRKLTQKNNLRLARPFLAVHKDRLTATCNAAQITFVNDPSNEHEAFARGRLRKILPLLAPEGMTRARLLDLGMRASDAAEALDHFTRNFLSEAASLEKDGAIHIDRRLFRDIPREIAGRALTACLQAIHAQDYAPEYASLLILVEALRRTGDPPTRTLHGAIVSASPKTITLVRETATLTDRLAIPPGTERLWDGRWLVTLKPEAEPDLTIAPLGNPSHETLDALAPDLRRTVPQGRARAALPSLWRGEQLIRIPNLEGDGIATARLIKSLSPIPSLQTGKML